MKKLMYQIKKILTRENINHFEIEYMKEEPYFISVRLYGENIETGKKMETCIKETCKNLLDTTVYTPHEDTVRFGFSGFDFTGLELEVNLKELTPLKEDFLLMDDNLHEI